MKICVSAGHGRQLHGSHGVQRHGRSGVSRLLKHSAALPREQAGGRQRKQSVGRHTWSRRLMLPRPRRDLRPAATEIRTRHAQVATTMRSRPGRPCATLANADHVAGASTQLRSAPGISEQPRQRLPRPAWLPGPQYMYIYSPYNTSAVTVGYTNLGYYGRLYKQLKSLKFFPPLLAAARIARSWRFSVFVLTSGECIALYESIAVSCCIILYCTA